MSTREQVRAVLNWLNLSTPLGLAIARAGGASARPDAARHLWLAEGYRLGFPVANAFTVGSVVITPHTVAELESWVPGTLVHETQHARQWTYCGGLPFLPAYVATMAWSWLRTGDKASACFFEQEAGLQLGGYRVLPRRSLRAGLADLAGRLPRPRVRRAR